MTPEDFAARAGAAVAELEPDATSYQWLTANVARRTRRRVLYAATAGATAAAVGAAALALPRDGGGGVVAPPSATATAVASSPAQRPSPTEPSWVGETERNDVDVDGDGRNDVVRVVQDGIVNGAPAWGIEVRLAGTTASALWECCENDSIELGPIADLDGDGDLEISVSLGSTATSREWELLVLTRDRESLETADGRVPFTGLTENGLESWGCAERGGVVVTRIPLGPGGEPGTSGTREYFRLEGTSLVQTGEVNDTWGNGTPRPAEYDTAFWCLS